MWQAWCEVQDSPPSSLLLRGHSTPRAQGRRGKRSTQDHMSGAQKCTCTSSCSDIPAKWPGQHPGQQGNLMLKSPTPT